LKGFTKAKECFAGGKAESKTSNCVQIILFLTDGKDTSKFKPSSLHSGSGKLSDNVVILTYSVGSGADPVMPKKIACQNSGIWTHVDDGGPINDAMASYYTLFAASIVNTEPRWTPKYQDSNTKTLLLAACMPIFDLRATNVQSLAGVVCMDLNVIIDLAKFKLKPGYAATMTAMRASATACPTITYPATTLRRLRLLANPAGVCDATDQTDDIPAPTVAPTGSGGGSTVNGARGTSGCSRMSVAIGLVFSLLASTRF